MNPSYSVRPCRWLASLLAVSLSLSNPLRAKCPTRSVVVRGKISCSFKPDDRVLAALVFFDNQPEASDAETTIGGQGVAFSGRVAFDTYSSSGPFWGDKCHRRPQSLVVKLVEANGIERDHTSLKIPSDFFYEEERGEYVPKSDVTLHGSCEPLNMTSRDNWRKLDAGPFSFLAPLGWGFHQLPGVDSYVGEFVGDGVVLTFDFGGYSNPLKEEKKPTYVVIHKSIDGHAAKIVSPRVPGHGITGVYFRNGGNASALTLFGKDLTSTQQELALKIFETLRFGGPLPRYVVPPPPPTKNVQ